MSYSFKTLLLSLMILVLPLMNFASNAHKPENDMRSAIRARVKTTVHHTDKISTHISKKHTSKKSTSPQLKNSEETSWSTYLVSGAKSVVKRTVQGTSDIMNFAIKNPKLAMSCGLVLALEKLLVAANCTCLCQFANEMKPYPYSYFGEQRDLAHCTTICKSTRAMWGNTQCI